RLTSLPIVQALRRAHDRGVKVRILLDRAQQSEKYSDATYFFNAGMYVKIYARHPIAHDKLILIDRGTVITGSCNLSANAEKNAENLLIINGYEKLARAYVARFSEHDAHCVPYIPPSETRP